MQAIAVFILLVAFSGACMAQYNDEPKCVVPKEDKMLTIDCMNETKGGKLDFKELLEDDKYFCQEDKNKAAMCIVKAKKYDTADQKLNVKAMKDDIKTRVTASDDIKKDIIEALDDCLKENEKSKNYIADTMECFTMSCMAICM